MLQDLTTMVIAVRRLRADVDLLNDHITRARDLFIAIDGMLPDDHAWKAMLADYVAAAWDDLDTIAAFLPAKKED